MTKLTSKEITKAVARFARKYNFSRDLVRVNTALRMRAFAEWRAVQK